MTNTDNWVRYEIKTVKIRDERLVKRLGWLTYEGRNNPEGSCEKILRKDEWQALYCVANNTKRLPGKPPTIGEAVLMIAKLGGFMARKSDGDPGLKVIWRGWRKLSSIMIGWNMARLVT